MHTLSKSSRTPIVVVLAVFATTNAVDFIFYGQQPHNLAALIGLSLTALGVVIDKKLIVSAGAVVAIAAIAAKYLW